jgi:hypothetical protein
MAVSEDNSGSAAKDTVQPASAPAPAVGHRAPPLWVVPLYVGGLVLVYLGERVLTTFESGRWVATVLGLLAVLAATLVRFSPRFRVGGERREIENLLAILSVIGVVALLLYFATTDWGMQAFGLSTADFETQESFEELLSVVWVSLLSIAVLTMLFAEAALFPMRHAERPESRRVRTAAAAGLAVALAATYGSLLVYAAEGFEVRADYSYFKTSRPSDSTRKMAQSLKDPIRVIAFFPDVNDVRNEVARYLSELSEGIPKLKVEIKDRLLLPKLARELRATQDGIIVLMKENTNERLTIGTDMKEARKKLKTLDQDFQEKLLKIVRSRRTAYLTVGHGEINEARGSGAEGRSAETVRELLQKQNYLVRDLGLAQGLGREVPDDASVVIVLGPSEPFATEEIATLKSYLNRGGHLLLALDPDALSPEGVAIADTTTTLATEKQKKADIKDKSKPTKSNGADAGAAPAVSQPNVAADGMARNLQLLAEIVDLKFDATILAHEQQHVPRRHNESDRTILVTPSFSSHASVSTLSRHAPRAAVIVLGSGSLDRGSASASKVDFTVRSMAGTFGDANRNYKHDGDAEKTSIYNLAAAVSRSLKPGKDPAQDTKDKDKDKDKKAKTDPAPEEMRAFVVADADVFSDLIMRNFGGNQMFFFDAVRWLGGEESFAGEISSEEDIRIEHTKKEDLLWFYATIFGAPALVFGVGLAISRRGRRSGRGKR